MSGIGTSVTSEELHPLRLQLINWLLPFQNETADSNVNVLLKALPADVAKLLLRLCRRITMIDVEKAPDASNELEDLYAKTAFVVPVYAGLESTETEMENLHKSSSLGNVLKKFLVALLQQSRQILDLPKEVIVAFP
jgi:hypothetical protein